MKLSLIAGIGRNNELGKDNQLLWSMPTDMKHFRNTTRRHAIIMGRKTFESIGHPLPERRNIVITRDANYKKDGIETVGSLEEAIALFKDSEEEVFIIGGAEIFKQSMGIAHRLSMTHIDSAFDADTFFPVIGSEWKKISEDSHPADSENQFPFTFVEYEK